MFTFYIKGNLDIPSPYVVMKGSKNWHNGTIRKNTQYRRKACRCASLTNDKGLAVCPSADWNDYMSNVCDNSTACE